MLFGYILKASPQIINYTNLLMNLYLTNIIEIQNKSFFI